MRHMESRRSGTRAWMGLGLLSLPTIVLGLDVTILYLVMPSLAAELEPTATQALWIMDAYGFLIAGFLITMGTLGDRIGRRRLLMIGMASFGLVSVLAAFAPTAAWLIAARALLGIAGATLMPSTLALISTLFDDARQRALAIGVWATMFALGMAAGPVVGGALLSRYWWGSAFLVAVPVAVIVLVAAPRLLPEYRDPQEGRFDIPSVGLSLGATLAFVYAVKHAASDGVDFLAILALTAGTAGAVVFVRRQLRIPVPLLDMSLFTNRAFSVALAVLLIGLIGVGGTMFLVTQYLQLVEELSATAAGIWMGPPALAMLVAAIGAPLVARHIRPGKVMAATLTLSLVGYGMLATADQGDRISVIAGFALVYLGLGAIAALGTDIVVGAAPASRAGSAAAISETVQELGLAVGVALLGSLTTTIYRTRMVVPPDASPETGDRLADSLSSATTYSDQVPAETIEHARTAFMVGFNTASMVAGGAIVAVTVLCTFALRHIRPIAGPEPCDDVSQVAGRDP